MHTKTIYIDRRRRQHTVHRVSPIQSSLSFVFTRWQSGAVVWEQQRAVDKPIRTHRVPLLLLLMDYVPQLVCTHCEHISLSMCVQYQFINALRNSVRSQYATKSRYVRICLWCRSLKIAFLQHRVTCCVVLKRSSQVCCHSLESV